MSYSSAAVLQMPSSYVPMSTEEMEYLEGGATKRTLMWKEKWLSAFQCAEVSRYLDFGYGIAVAILKVAPAVSASAAILNGITKFVLDGGANRNGLYLSMYKLQYSSVHGSRGDVSYTYSVSYN